MSHQKQAFAISNLVDNGYSFEDAVSLVKEAASGAAFKEMAGQAGKLVAATGRLGGRAAKVGATKARSSLGAAANTVGSVIKKHPYAAAAAGAAGLAGVSSGLGYAAYRRAHQKEAAMQKFLDAGVDFEKAAQLVLDIDYQVYGE